MAGADRSRGRRPGRCERPRRVASASERARRGSRSFAPTRPSTALSRRPTWRTCSARRGTIAIYLLKYVHRSHELFREERGAVASRYVAALRDLFLALARMMSRTFSSSERPTWSRVYTPADGRTRPPAQLVRNKIYLAIHPPGLSRSDVVEQVRTRGAGHHPAGAGRPGRGSVSRTDRRALERCRFRRQAT